MDRIFLQNLFIEILRSELNETELDISVKEQLTPEVISALYSLSKHHDLAHIVASAFQKSGILADDDISKELNKQKLLSVYRNEQMKISFSEICEILENAEIKYIPLKGSVIRPYYPEESMRTSCDIDILIPENDIETATAKFTENGYKLRKKNFHDVSLFSPTGIHLELHFNILEDIENLDSVLKRAWQYAVATHGHRYDFSSEFFLFHMFAHISYHFLHGGCGIRSLMDIWIMKHKINITYLQAESLLKEAEIYQFAEEISRLADVCFSNTEKTVFDDTLLSYIINGGVYGTKQNSIAVTKTKVNNNFLYTLKRLFLPYRKMTYKYPILKKVPVLLPVFWLVRIFQGLFSKKSTNAITELKTATNMSEEEINTMKEIKDRLGL